MDVKEKGQQVFKTIRELRAKKVIPAIIAGGGAVLSFTYFSFFYDGCHVRGATVETLASVVAGQLECEGIETLAKDINGIFDDLDVCGEKKDKLPEALIVDLPDGTWTSSGATCMALLPRIEELIIKGKAPDPWKCKNATLDRAALEASCQKLE